MVEPFDSQAKDNRASACKATNTPLRLVVSNLHPLPSSQELSPLEILSLKKGFVTEICMRGPSFYKLIACDFSNYLECDLILEVCASKPWVVCHFPIISDDKLKEFIWQDELLLGIVLIQFHMKILERLLTFCSTRPTLELVLYANDSQTDALEIYREFLVYGGQVLSEEKRKVTIPVNQKTLDNLTAFSNELDKKCRQTLWREQRKNPAVYNYLKTHPFG